MVKVAFAGATNGLGRIILDAILETKKHKVIVLSRTSNPDLTNNGVDVRQVDYTNHQSLTSALQGVHTVLSTLGGFDPNQMRDAQLALLAAAKEAGAKRFAPSEYALSSNDYFDLYAGKIAVWNAAQASGLEVTRFTCGIFMNTLGTGTPKGEAEALGGLRPWNFVVNMKAGTADLPGDGNARLTFTRTQDIGRFVAAALDLDRWEEEMAMVGESHSYNEVIVAIEKVTGRKMLVKHNSVEELEKMIREDEAARFYNQVRLAIAKGKAVIADPKLNNLFPKIVPWSVEDYLQRYWSGVELEQSAWAKDTVIA